MLVQAVPRQSGRKLILSDAGVQAAVTDIDVDFTPPSDKDENESDAASEEAGEDEAEVEKKQPGDTGSQKKKRQIKPKGKTDGKCSTWPDGRSPLVQAFKVFLHKEWHQQLVHEGKILDC